MPVPTHLTARSPLESLRPRFYLRRVRGILLAGLALATSVLTACELPNDSTGPGGGGTDAGPDLCPTGPEAMLNLTIKAADGPVPFDTVLHVSWSAGQEPPFDLADPATWGTLDSGANVVCEVDPGLVPPLSLPALVCHLWTSGVTQVGVNAAGYEPYDSTLKPETSPTCKVPVPTAVDVTLTPTGDAGAP
jgi:hypothetical protein